ncbi:MAG: metallophosphoesterase [Candidatus Micrarchaeia archaeon]
MLKFVNSKPALIIENNLVVSDLHIGIEEKLKEKGISVPDLSKIMGKDIKKIFDESKANRLILLGDIKESIGYPTKFGYSCMSSFFEEIKGIDTIIVKGNHDAHLAEVLSILGYDYKIEKEMLLKSAALAHGNAYPSKVAISKKYLIIGHGHAAYGHAGEAVEKIWIIASSRNNKKLVLVPAFNPMISGSNIRNWTTEMGIIKAGSFNMNSASVFDLYGKLLGKLGVLAKQDWA